MVTRRAVEAEAFVERELAQLVLVAVAVFAEARTVPRLHCP
jgi:hypothetical protein